MKLTLNLTALALFSFLFFSCKNDSIVNSGGTLGNVKYFDWSSNAATYDQIFFIHTIDRQSYFAWGYSNFYKVTNNIAVPFSEMNSEFHTENAYPYESNYIVFTGFHFTTNRKAYMIENNGIYTIYDRPESHDTINLSEPFFAEKGKFYYALFTSGKYCKFDNGTYTEYTLPSGTIGYSSTFGKTNGKVYLFAVNSDQTRVIYRLDDSGPILLRNESSDGYLYPVKSDMIKWDFTGYTYFTEQGWSKIFDIQPHQNFGFPYALTGENRNKFIVVSTDSLRHPYTSIWDGMYFTKQSNFPEAVSTVPTIGFYHGEFIDNTFYLVVFDDNARRTVVKAVVRE